MSQKKLKKFVLMTLLAGALTSTTAYALPQGGSVITANASMTTGSNSLAVTGVNAPVNVAIKWQNFDIGKGETVSFSNMQNVLNYVAGGSTRSEIYGALNAPNTNVYVVNPHGVMIGDGAQITAQSFTASGRTMADNDLKNFNGTLPTATVTSSYGDVLNLGSIKANGVTFEGNNVTLRNTADIKDATGTAVLSSTNANGNVTIKATAAANVEVGYDVANTKSRNFTINGTTTAKEVHDYTSPVKTNAGSTLGYSVNGTTQAAAQDFMLVDNVYDLQNMDSNLGGKYMLNPAAGSNGVLDATGTATWGAKNTSGDYSGFTPVGGNGKGQFYGTFEGLNFAIDGLTILQPATADVGLFGYVQKNTVNGTTYVGTVKNLELSNLNLYGDNYVGGVAGRLGGKVQNIKTSGQLMLQAGTTYSMIGGVVGYISNKETSAYIDQCYNKATIIVPATANNNLVFAGGVIGEVYSVNGSLSNSINTGNILVYGGKVWNDSLSKIDSHAGGIAASNYGTVENSYNTGTIWVYDNRISAAGVVGKTQGASSKVQYTYNTGNIWKGGTITVGTDGTVTNSKKIDNTNTNLNYVQGSGIIDTFRDSASISGIKNNYLKLRTLKTSIITII